MSPVDQFLADLDAALLARGRTRTRLLIECRGHLEESSADHGPAEAVRRFGPATDLARSFDTEVAARRSLQATALSVGGVLGVGAAALAMLNAVDAHASAPVGWAVVFFGSAQASAACTFLAVLRAAAMRREIASPDEVRLLCRRNTMALGFALLALFAVGAGLPGHTAAWKVLAGPAIAVIAALSVTRVRRLTRKLDPHRSSIVRTPLTDAATLAGRSTDAPVSRLRSGAVLPLVVLLAAVAAFTWDLLDHGSVAASGAAAAIEATMTIGGFLFLGRGLGLHTATLSR